MADFIAIATNLLTLEINTVLKNGMSSQKMPSSEDAVVDIIENYCDYLCRRVPTAWADEHAFVSAGPVAIDPGGLQTLRRIALRLKTETRQPDEILGVLSRIQRNCDQMMDFVTGTVSRNTRLRLTTEQTILLRKAWEIGTETVAMQTVIQIDGDVVTRVQPGREDGASAALHAAHRQSVELSFRYWQFLADTLGRMAGALMKDLLR
jgi:hypothetical protein